MPDPTTGTMTLIDWARKLDPDGSTSRLVQALNLANPVLPADHGIRTTTAWTTMDWGILYHGVRQYPWGTARVFEYGGR